MTRRDKPVVKKNTIYVTNSALIPIKHASKRKIVEHYETDLFNEQVCSSCSNLQFRVNDICMSCEAYGGTIKSWSKRKLGGKSFIGVPCGDLDSVVSRLGLEELKIVDKRKVYPFEHKIKFTSKLYSGEVVNGSKTTNQVQVVADWMKTKTGMIESVPRSGKTVMATNIICTMGQKTIIIANQEALLENFNKTLVGDPNTGLKAMTNIPKLRKKTGKPIVGIVKSLQQCLDEDLDIAMITYQKFIRDKGKSFIKEFNKRYSLLVIDEAHGIGADCFSHMTSEMRMLHRLALSATPERKDGREFLVHDHMGPIVAKSTATALLPKIELWETGLARKGGGAFKLWVYFVKYISSNEDRNRMIVRQVFKDLRAGHKAIIIPVTTIAHLDILVKRINRQAKLNRIKRNEKWGKELAVAYQSKTKDQTGVLAAVDSGEHQVLVAIYSMVKQGIDLKAPSVLYVNTPTSNPAMFYQLSNRICTPSKDKKQPVIRLMVDNFVQSTGCFRSLFFNEILKRLKDSATDTKRYLMSQDDVGRAFEICKSGRNYIPQTRKETEKKASSKKATSSTGSRFDKKKKKKNKVRGFEDV